MCIAHVHYKRVRYIVARVVVEQEKKVRKPRTNSAHHTQTIHTQIEWDTWAPSLKNSDGVQHTCTSVWCVGRSILISAVFTWILKYSERKKEGKKDKATQSNTRPKTTFPKEKAVLRWDLNPRLTLSRRDALPTELLRQLSWLSLNTYTNQGKAMRSEHLNLINRWILNLVINRVIKPPKTPNSILSDVQVSLSHSWGWVWDGHQCDESSGGDKEDRRGQVALYPQRRQDHTECHFPWHSELHVSIHVYTCTWKLIQAHDIP